MATGDRAIRCIVAGRVQGVYFRAATREQAGALDLRGWVRNLPDRTVEVLAAGDPDRLGALTEWLWRGSPAARVTSVAIEEWTGDVPEGFAIR